MCVSSILYILDYVNIHLKIILCNFHIFVFIQNRVNQFNATLWPIDGAHNHGKEVFISCDHQCHIVVIMWHFPDARSVND